MSNIPEQGQLVEVRSRPFVVTAVARSTLPVDLMEINGGQIHHLVTLASVEDDALGEELQVIWEREPDSRIVENATLPAPTGFDPPHQLDAFLNAVRWGASVSADGRALQAPFRSGIDIEDYQLDPLVRAIGMPRANLLIADDVGLGKTIEAGLVAQELIMRQHVRRVLIVCPSSLQIQWKDQMRDKFGLEFRIVDSDLMAGLRRSRGIHVNPWSHFPRLITSIDYLKRDQPMRLFRETLPSRDESTYPRRYDLLIVDEAHNVAPSGRGRYAIDSLRTRAVRELVPHFEHKLFLTATPHNGYKESFSALLELLDNQRFARGVEPEAANLAAVMVRRLKTELPPDDFGQPRFPERRLEAIEVQYTHEEREIHRKLQAYTRLRHRHAIDASERTATEFVLKLLKKRLFSSPAAFAKTLEKHLETLSGVRRQPDEERTRQRTRPAPGILRARLENLEEDAGDDLSFDEATATALHTAASNFSPLTPEEKRLLGEMAQWANQAAMRSDSKAQVLIEWLKAQIRPNGQWTDRRVIIFTEYRDTQNWLHGLLAGAGLAGDGRTLTLYGGMKPQDRELIKAAFQAAPDVSPVRILLATDAASEGIDLQLHCRRLIHYEIPWNPNRMEQRNGRIDRHGQRHHPAIYHFVPAGYNLQPATQPLHSSAASFGTAALTPTQTPGALEWDMEFLMLAVRKVEQIREDLGKVGPVIADQVTEAMLGRRDRLQTADAEREAAPVRQMLKFERDLTARIAQLHEQLQETKRELQLSPQNIQSVVEIALDLAGQPRLQEATLPGIWPDERGRYGHCPVFHLPPLRGPGWARCAEGLAHPHTGEMRPIVFDHNLSRGRDDVVLAHLNHRLVQMSLRLLRAEVWSRGGRNRLHRVAVRLVPDHILNSLAVVAHARLVVIGGDSQRLHEEIIQSGGEIREGRFRRFESLGRMESVLQAATHRQPSPAVAQKLTALWPNLEAGLSRALDVRMGERVQSLERLLEQRLHRELGDIEAILNELARAIRQELNQEPAQLPLFNEEERDQYARNFSALEARLGQIPAELAEEQAAIRRRYADPQPRLFPVAVTFLVPERLGR
ncbi:MAG: DISARM system SNF2-like helicase DrmD [Caldilineaceae bacterium]|nr:DISARM system SNF2-like helicase DrmD [Caldilineaceae bacterium]